MTTTYRPPTIEERFFHHATFVKVPVSIPPGNLPEASTAPVDINPPAPDLTLSNLNEPNLLPNIGSFISNHWGKILSGLVIAGLVYWYYKTQKEKSEKSRVFKWEPKAQ